MSRVGFVRIRIRTKRIRIWAWSYRFASCTYGHCTGTSVNVWNLGCTVCMYVYLSPCSAWSLATRCSIRVDSWNSMMKLWNCREPERTFVLNFLFIFRKSSGAISSGDELKNGTTDNNKAQKTDNKDEKTDKKGEKTDNKDEKTDNKGEKTDNKDEKTDKKDENNSTVTDKKDQEGGGIRYNCPEFTCSRTLRDHHFVDFVQKCVPTNGSWGSAWTMAAVGSAPKKFAQRKLYIRDQYCRAESIKSWLRLHSFPLFGLNSLRLGFCICNIKLNL